MSAAFSAGALDPQGVAQHLSPACRAALRLQVQPQVTSTNLLLRRQAEQGAPEGTALLADAQTAGRGRLGRQFYSPEGTGLYLSLLLRPAALPLDRAVHITTMAAVAVCRAIEELGGGPAQIKWVNDVFLHGRKVCRLPGLGGGGHRRQRLPAGGGLSAGAGRRGGGGV